jgi:hypothetical protein
MHIEIEEMCERGGRASASSNRAARVQGTVPGMTDAQPPANPAEQKPPVKFGVAELGCLLIPLGLCLWGLISVIVSQVGP